MPRHISTFAIVWHSICLILTMSCRDICLGCWDIIFRHLPEIKSSLCTAQVVSVRAPLTAHLLLRLPARCSEPGPVEWPPQFQPTTTSTCIASHAAWRAKLHWVPVLQDSAPMVPKPDLRGRCAEFGTHWIEVWSALGERPQPELSAPAARSPHNPFPL